MTESSNNQIPTKGRSAEYSAYLRRILEEDPERYRDLLAAEAAYMPTYEAKLAQAAYQAEEAQYGYAESPAGSGDGEKSYRTGRHAGDWSWQPGRDKALGANMITYRPRRHPLAGIRFNETRKHGYAEG